MNFQKRKLSNGITILHESRNLPVVSFSISNPFAGSHEPSDIKGIAHFIEHLLFTGTKTRTHEDISREIEKRGGVLNAFTAQDVTSFWFKLPSEHLFAGIDILVDMLKNPLFDSEKFEKEKKVILEEIKMHHDNPRQHVFKKIEENLYEKPFGEGIIGSKKTISALKRNFVASYFKQKYSPQNYIITIIGCADFQKICEYIEKSFPSTDSAQNKTPLKHVPIKTKNAYSTEERQGIDQAHFVFAVQAPPATDKNRYVLEVLDAYLASGMSSRLFLEIREKRGLAYAVQSSINQEKNYSYYSIYIGTTKLAIEKVKELIIGGFHAIDHQMSESDLQESKERLIGLRKVSSEESIHVMNELMYEELSTSNAESYYDHGEKINSVTLEQVKALAKKLIHQYSTAAIVPK
jgi:predicted Zn-dependent peptidase